MSSQFIWTFDMSHVYTSYVYKSMYTMLSYQVVFVHEENLVYEVISSFLCVVIIMFSCVKMGLNI